MINLTRITPEALSSEPYQWAFIDRLFSRDDGEALVQSYPHDHYKTVTGYDGEKGYQYEARSLLHMGACAPSYPRGLSEAWLRLTADLLSDEYRTSMSQLTGLDLTHLQIEANLFHYGQSAWLGPHVDLEDKLVTHVFYFNEIWNVEDGGCLTILEGPQMAQSKKVIPPLIGNSVVLVRSTKSWHAVSRVREDCRTSRRSLAVTFYRPGALSTMWPAGDKTPLHDYKGEPSAFGRVVRKVRQRLTTQ